MPKITSVEPQKKDPKRFNIYLDGQFGFGADEDTIVKYRLIVGKVLDPQQLQKVLFDSEVGKLLGHLYNLFSFRQRSEKEVRDYLKNKSYKQVQKDKEPISDLVIDAAIETLKQRGMLNDLEFAKAWVQSRRSSKKIGDRLIKAELYKKGIEREIIEQVINEQLDINNEEVRAEQTLEKKLNSWKNLDRQQFKKKSSEFLLRRGFDYAIVRDVVAKFMAKL